MSLYAQTSIPDGSTYRRASSIVINNALTGPTVVYNEEVVVLSNATPILSKPDGMILGTVDLGGSIALRDPNTGELTGQSLPVATLYTALYSDYVNRALARDALANTAPA